MLLQQHPVQLALTDNNKDGIAILCWKAESLPQAPANKRLQTLNPASKYLCQQHLKGSSLSTFQWRECQINSPSSSQSQQRLRRQTLAYNPAEDAKSRNLPLKNVSALWEVVVNWKIGRWLSLKSHGQMQMKRKAHSIFLFLIYAYIFIVLNGLNTQPNTLPSPLSKFLQDK